MLSLLVNIYVFYESVPFLLRMLEEFGGERFWQCKLCPVYTYMSHLK